VRLVNRRLSLVLSAAALAALAPGCATFSDSSNVARVNDVALTADEFQTKLTETGAPSDQPLPGDAVRAEITTWIQEQLVAADTGGDVDEDEIAALYDAGIESSGIICLDGIIVQANDTARRVADELSSGADFDELLASENVEPSLGEVGGEVGCLTSVQVAGAPDVEVVQSAAGLSAENSIAVAPLVDPEGNVGAWIVLSFRPFDELSPTDVDTVTTAIDGATRLATADVFVDPRYGTFDATTGQVVALG
jgi:hypothetical protein